MVLQELGKGGALVAVGHQMTVLPQDPVGLDPPRVMEGAEDRCKKPGAEMKNRDRACACRRK